MFMKISTHSILFVTCAMLLLGACQEEEPQPACDGSLALMVTGQTNSDCDKTDGQLVLTATGGTGSYQYSLDGSTFQASGQFSNLAPGRYDIEVKDGNDCVTTLSANVLSGLTLENDIRSIIQTNCAVSGCHDGSNANRPNFTEDGTIRSRASNIKARTSNKTMPPSSSGQSLTDEEIALLACWADDGAP